MSSGQSILYSSENVIDKEGSTTLMNGLEGVSHNGNYTVVEFVYATEQTHTFKNEATAVACTNAEKHMDTVKASLEKPTFQFAYKSIRRLARKLLDLIFSMENSSRETVRRKSRKTYRSQLQKLRRLADAICLEAQEPKEIEENRPKVQDQTFETVGSIEVENAEVEFRGEPPYETSNDKVISEFKKMTDLKSRGQAHSKSGIQKPRSRPVVGDTSVAELCPTNRCPICGKVFQNQSARKHVCESVLGDIALAKLCPTKRCPICGKVFSNHRRARNHVAVMHSQHDNPCNMCAAKFRTAAGLRQHVRCQHHSSNISKNIQCSDQIQNNGIEAANPQFQRSNDIFKSREAKDFKPKHPTSRKPRIKKTHSKTIVGDTPVAKVCPTNRCPICEKVFTDHRCARKHVAKVHSQQDIPCSMCAAKFRTSTGLRQHVRRQHQSSEISTNIQCPVEIQNAGTEVTEAQESSQACEQILNPRHQNIHVPPNPE